MKLTEWYPAHIKPAREGIYQQMSFDGKDVGYQYWNGKHWGAWWHTIEVAIKFKTVGAISTGWRGLAEKP